MRRLTRHAEIALKEHPECSTLRELSWKGLKNQPLLEVLLQHLVECLFDWFAFSHQVRNLV